MSLCGAEELTEWMKEKIVKSDFKAIFRYDIDGKTYYGLSSSGKDMLYPLYDAAGSYVCSPSGGFFGQGDGKCPELRKKLQDQGRVKIWERPQNKNNESEKPNKAAADGLR
jgi:hypothetical protein